MDSDFEPLSALQARVLGVLVEKQHTVPDTYPLTLHMLVAGCNQKTARHPVMEVSEPEVIEAVDGLKQRSLVAGVSGHRVPRFEQNLARGLNVPGQGVALLAVLILRGPQTSAELRLNSERLHRFADVSSVEAFLDELAAKMPPRVLRLPRALGEREARWVHLLCGQPPAAPLLASRSTAVPSAGELAELRAEVARQGAELAELREQLSLLQARLQIELGLKTPTS